VKKNLWKSLKWIGLTISLASIGITIMLMMSGKQETTHSDHTQDTSKTQVESPVIVERKDGQVTWQLRAEEAQQQLDGKMHLITPTLILFTDNGKKIYINSKQAWFEPLSRNVQFKDQVVVHDKIWVMHSEVLIYDSSKDEISVPGLFRIEGKNIHAHGKQMHMHRITQEIHVESGIWIEDSDPHWQGALQ